MKGLYLYMRFISALIICLLGMGCASVNVKKQMRAAEVCQKEWQYFTLEQTVKARVLSHQSGLCRYRIASTTIAITTAGDTIRVVELCGKGKLSQNDSILITPITEAPESKRRVTNIAYDCQITRTCYGTISRIN